MTRPTKSLAAFVTTLALFYLLGAFVAWDWNAGEWGDDNRFVLFMAALMAAIIAASIAGEKP